MQAFRPALWIALLAPAFVAAPAAAQTDPAKAAFQNSPCETCHGPDANGDGPGPALVPLDFDQSDFTVMVRGGIGHMPAIPQSDLSDADLVQVYAYLKRLSDEASKPVEPVASHGGGDGVADLHARIDRARRASDLIALGAAADDARKLAAEADLGAAIARFEAIVQSPPPATGGRANPDEANALLQTIAKALKDSGAKADQLAFLDGVAAALTSSSAASLDAAERQLRHATDVLPAKVAPGDAWPEWTAADAWAWLGKVLAQKGDLGGARRAYSKALDLEPNFIWVTRVLLPALR